MESIARKKSRARTGVGNVGGETGRLVTGTSKVGKSKSRTRKGHKSRSLYSCRAPIATSASASCRSTGSERCVALRVKSPSAQAPSPGNCLPNHLKETTLKHPGCKPNLLPSFQGSRLGLHVRRGSASVRSAEGSRQSRLLVDYKAEPRSQGNLNTRWPCETTHEVRRRILALWRQVPEGPAH